MDFKMDSMDSEKKQPAAMEMETGGEVLPVGPRPGMAICSFGQGRVEIALRVMAIMVGSLPALLSAALALAMHLFGDINVNVPRSGFLSPLLGPLVLTFLSASYVIIIAGLAILKELVMIILRLCNCGCVNLGINIILIIAIIFSYLFSFCHLVGGMWTLVSAVGWGPSYNPIIAGEKATLSLCSIFCFLAAILYLLQASWSIAFLAKQWNKNVEKYTLEHLVTK